MNIHLRKFSNFILFTFFSKRSEPKKILPSPNLSPHGERLKLKVAETDDFSCLLASRDYGLYCLCARGAITNTMLKHRGGCRAAGGTQPPKSEENE